MFNFVSTLLEPTPFPQIIEIVMNSQTYSKVIERRVKHCNGIPMVGNKFLAEAFIYQFIRYLLTSSLQDQQPK